MLRLTSTPSRCETMCRKTVTLIVPLLLLPYLASATGLYKWIDADGTIHYGQSPPPSTPANEVKLKSDGISNKEASRNLRRLKEKAGMEEPTLDEEIRREEEEGKRVAEVEAFRRESCAIARNNLELMQDNTRQVVEKDADGNSVPISEEKKQAQMDKTLGEIKEYCD